MDNEGIVLTSPAPMKDTLKQYNVFYVVFFVLGALYAISMQTGSWLMAGAIGLAVAFIIKMVIAIGHLHKLRKLKFYLHESMSGQDMAGMITYQLTQLGMEVNVDKGDAVVKYKGMLYYVVDNNDNTFSLLFDRTFASGMIGGRRYISEFKKAIIAIGLIAYAVQSEMSKLPGFQT